MLGGSAVTGIKKLNAARLYTPSVEHVLTNAMGRGTIELHSSLYRERISISCKSISFIGLAEPMSRFLSLNGDA